MIIILEGADGVGKSTLAANIKAASTGGTTTILRSGPPTKEMSAWKHCQVLLDLMARSDGDFVVDRMHIGEMCYGPLFRKRSTITADEAFMIDQRLIAMGALRVWLDLPPSVLHDRLSTRDGDVPDPKSGAALKHIRPLRAAYSAAIGENGSLPGWLRLDSNVYPEQLAADVIARAQRLAASPRVNRGWYGSAMADRVILTLGDMGDQAKAGQMARMLKLCNMAGNVAVVDDIYDGPPPAAPPARGVVGITWKANQRGRESGWTVTETVSSLRELVKVAR